MTLPVNTMYHRFFLFHAFKSKSCIQSIRNKTERKLYLLAAVVLRSSLLLISQDLTIFKKIFLKNIFIYTHLHLLKTKRIFTFKYLHWNVYVMFYIYFASMFEIYIFGHVWRFVLSCCECDDVDVRPAGAFGSASAARLTFR